MKPKTKLQKEVYSLHTKLRPIPQKVYAWSKNQMASLFSVDSRYFYRCYECNHKWRGKRAKKIPNTCRCPNCNKILQHYIHEGPVIEYKHMGYVTTYKEYQLIRIIYVYKMSTKTRKPFVLAYEVSQIWMNSRARATVLSRDKTSCFYNAPKWSFKPDMTIRSNKCITIRDSLLNYIYPHTKVLPIITRNGFNGDFCKYYPYALFKALLTNSRFETAYKAGYTNLLRSDDVTDDMWRIIKICIRQKYEITDVKMWKDYLDLLAYYHKDIFKPELLCPPDIKEAHDMYMARRNEEIRVEREKERLKQEYKKLNRYNNDLYVQSKAPFLGLSFTNGIITISVLNSVNEFIKEGKIMEHCVFANDYHMKPNSLIMTSKLKTKPLETIEVSLDKLEVIQAYGHNNQITKYHNDIINLVNQNMKLIKERLNKMKTKCPQKT